MKISLCNEVLPLPWGQALEVIKGIGFDGVEVAPYTLASDVRLIDRAKREKLLEAAHNQGLEICGLHWLLVSPPGLHLAHPDPSARERTVDYLGELARFCADLGGRVMVLGSPKQRSTLPGQSREEAWALLRDSLKRACRYAEDYGVTIALEPLARHLTDIVNTVGEASRMVEQVGSPALRINLDVYSMTDENRPYGEIIREAGPLLAHFHANDTGGMAPGTGCADYRGILSALKSIGYRGWLSIEILAQVENPVEAARGGLFYLRSLLTEL